MKKLLLMLFGTFVTFISCNKNAEDIVALPKPVLIKSITMPNKNVISGVSTELGRYKFTVPNIEEFLAGPDILFEGTFDLSNLSDLFFILKKEMDTTKIVYKSTVRRTVLDVNWYDYLKNSAGVSCFEKNTTYIMYVYGTSKLGSEGIIQSTVRFASEWNGGNNVTNDEPGQKITIVPYPNYPVIKQVTVNDRIDTTIVKQFNKIHAEVVGGDTCTFPQISFGVRFTTQTADTIVKQLTMWKNGVNVTTKGQFINSSGAIVTYLLKSDTKVHFVFTTGGGEDTLVRSGDYAFGGKSCVLGDMGTTFLTTDNISSENRFLNMGLIGNNLKLYLNPTPSGNALTVNTIFSYFKHPHSASRYLNKGDFVAFKGNYEEQVMY